MENIPGNHTEQIPVKPGESNIIEHLNSEVALVHR